MKRRFGSFMQRYSHSIPIFCQILGARFNVPASKSMVAPRAMNTFHRLGSNTLLSTKQEDLAVCIILMIHIIRGEKAGTRNRFLNWSLQQLAEQVEDLTVTHHPFRLLIHVIKLPVLLNLNQMIKIRRVTRTPSFRFSKS